MLGGPALLDRMELRQAEPRRPGHWFFLGNALDDHIFLADQVRRGLQDAREAVRESVTTTDPPTVVVGQESIFQEFAFQEAYPRARTSVLARGYMIRLLEVRDDDGRLLGYLMDKGQPGPPLAILESLGFTFGHPVRIRRTGPQVDRGP